MKKERGKFLTIVLFIFSLSVLYSLYLIFFKFNQINLENFNPIWYFPYRILVNLVAIVLIYGLWKFQKWGIYLSIISWIISFLDYLVIFFKNSSGAYWPYSYIPAWLSLIIVSTLWFWAIYRKRQYFK